MTLPQWFLDQQDSGIAETADELSIRWAKRDAEYAKLGRLDIDTIAAIKAARKREASLLPPADRAQMWARANAWDPPAYEYFGSLRDWLEE